MILLSRLKILATIYVDNITMLTLIKLLDISIVASSSFGFLRRFKMAASFLPFLVFSDSRSDGDREKKAVSDPETIPEKNTRITRTMRPINVSELNPRKNCSDTVTIPFKRESGSVSSKI